MPKKDKNPVSEMKAETTAQGIKVSLGNDEWVLFSKKNWTWTDRLEWNSSDDLHAMQLILEWTADWHLKDEQGADIPFEREKLQEDIATLNISWAKVRALARAVFFAFAEAAKTPLA